MLAASRPEQRAAGRQGRRNLAQCRRAAALSPQYRGQLVMVTDAKDAATGRG
jgi:hypothetical protein